MKIIKPISSSIFYRTYKYLNKNYLSLSVNLFLDNTRNSIHLLTEQEMWRQFNDVSVKDFSAEFIDMGMPKSQNEIIVYGYGYGKYAIDCVSAVSLEFGGHTKSLRVFGEREWIGGDITKPKPFEKIPISWSNAFGGEGFDKNPLGRGLYAASYNDRRFLPHIESHSDLIREINQKVDPVSFSPLPLEYPKRNLLLGTYDEEWKKKYFPGFAEDIDWSYFNNAPKDQRIKSLDNLDLAFVNMHPEKKRVIFSIPEIKVKVFLVKRDFKFNKVVELDLNSCTAYPNEERYILSYHSSVEIEEPNADENYDCLMCVIELPDCDRGLEYYANVYRLRSDLVNSVKYAVFDDMLVDQRITTKVLPDIELGEMNKKYIKHLKLQLQALEDVSDSLKLDGKESPDHVLKKIYSQNNQDLTKEKKFKEEIQLIQSNSDEHLYGSDAVQYLDILGINKASDLDKFIESELIDPTNLVKDFLKVDNSLDKSPLQLHREKHKKDKELKKIVEGLNSKDPTEEEAKELFDNAKQQISQINDLFNNEQQIKSLTINKPSEDLINNIRLIESNNLPDNFADGYNSIFLKSISLKSPPKVDSIFREVDSLEQIALFGYVGIFTKLNNKKITDIKLSDGSYEYCMFYAADFENVDFSNSTLENNIFLNCSFKNCNFQNSSLDNSLIYNCSFVDCNLDSVSNDRLSIELSKFKDCFISSWSHTKIFFRDVGFFDCNINLTSFTKAFAPKLIFSNCNIDKTTFVMGKLGDLRLSGCSGESLNFANTRGFNIDRLIIEDCDFKYLYIEVNTVIKDSLIKNSSLKYSTIRKVKFPKCVFLNSDFDFSDFSYSEFKDSVVDLCSFNNGILTKLILENSRWIKSDISQAFFNRVTLINTQLYKISFFSSDVSELHTDKLSVISENLVNRANFYPLSN